MDPTAAPPDPLVAAATQTDWPALLVAVLAVLVAVWSAWYTVRVSRQTSKDADAAAHKAAQAATYQRLHETLVTPEAASGRRLLFIAARQKDFPGLGDPNWDRINYSLALYDTLGGYLHQNMVDETMVLRAWHHPLQEIRQPVKDFMAHRAQHSITQPWSFLHHLLDKATAYTCDCPTQPGVPPAPGRPEVAQAPADQG